VHKPLFNEHPDEADINPPYVPLRIIADARSAGWKPPSVSRRGHQLLGALPARGSNFQSRAPPPFVATSQRL